MADISTSNIADILNQANQYDDQANSLSSIASGFTPNSPLSAILKGVVGGLALTKKGQAQSQREIDNQRLRELANYEIQLKQHQAQVQNMLASHQEATQTGTQLAQGIEQAQLGDESGIKNWLASNPATQQMLGQRIGVPVESAKVANINGVDVIQAYGRDANGNLVMDPNPVPVDAYLKAYAPEAYAARSAQRLETTAAQLKNDKLTAEIATENAQRRNFDASAGEHNANAAAASAPDGNNGAAPAKPVKITTDQSNAAVFGKRMEDANTQLNDLFSKGYMPNVATNTLTNHDWGNFLLSEQGQQFDQARRNFVNAVLRRESGAAISSSEFDNANKQYFPMPGDTQKVLEQKAANRQRAIEGMQVGAGPAWQSISDKTPTEAAAPDPNEIKAQYKAGKITRQQAEEQLRAIGYE
ncbi:hypothetical protein [Bradyrhizobium manausense]|uniref:hypothetical protein n=1 Tax=Bradyrhizobium manausense TaxID=989370 RepID=UPI001BAAFDC6|nr:hypothetical protein [Bradyrhizobium manausense]MBR0721763.1 hypothetical protein [Bradyrhizobium manausense]